MHELLFRTDGQPGIDRAPVMVAFGGGLDSSAMCVGLVERDLRPDAILFANTGGELPETYDWVARFSAWLEKQGFPPVTTVQNDGKYGTLEKNCLELEMLPSLAYGHRSCSDKYKIRPQHKWAKAWEPARLWWQLDLRNRRQELPRDTPLWRREGVVKCIGYDAGEGHRSDVAGDDFYQYVYPLRVWGWHRLDCEAALRRVGLEVPVKSSCFFCPARKKHEVLTLQLSHPELFARALRMEDNAAENLQTVKGLGRGWSWRRLAEGDPQPKTSSFPVELGCICQGPVYTEEGADAPGDEITSADPPPPEPAWR